MEQKSENNLSIQRLLGKTVINRQCELLGYVRDLEIEREHGKINFLELGIDACEPPASVFIPWSQVRFDRIGEKLVAPFSLRFLQSIAKPSVSSR